MHIFSDEIKNLFELTKHKIAFCENDAYDIYMEVIKDLGLDTKVVTFGDDERGMKKFIEKYDDRNDLVDNFK